MFDDVGLLRDFDQGGADVEGLWGVCLLDAVAKRDVPVIQACGLVFAGVFVILNTVADILAILANPRLRRRR